MGRQSSRFALLTVLAAAAIALAPLLALAPYAFPSADDYCLAVEAQRGFWRMQSYFFLSWTGRYTATAIQTVFSQADLPTIYPWVCSITLLGTIVAVRLTVGAIWPPDTPRLHLVAASAAGVAVLVGRLPSSTEAFYWMTSAISYQWGLIAYLAWLSLLIRISRGGQPRLAHRFAITVLTMALPGFNEVMLPIVLGTIAVFALRARRAQITDRFMLAQLFAAIALTVVSLVAPGNAMRSGTYPDIPSRHDVGFALVETAEQTARFLGNFGSYPALWVAALAAWCWGPRGVMRLAPVHGRRLAAAAVVAPVALVYITLFPLYWEYGAVNYTGEGRTYNVTYFAFCGSVILATAIILGRAAERWPGLTLRQRGAADLFLAGALAISILGSPGTLSAYRALRAAPEYLEAQRAREAILRAPQNRGKMLVVDAMHIRPEGLFWGGIQADEDHWINSCIASYYGLASVRTPRATPSN